MAKKRPSPEQQTSDRSMVAGCAQILGPLATRYPAQLEAAVTLLRAFAASKVEVPAKRKASTKADDKFHPRDMAILGGDPSM
jgi:hypothetical protein